MLFGYAMVPQVIESIDSQKYYDLENFVWVVSQKPKGIEHHGGGDIGWRV